MAKARTTKNIEAHKKRVDDYKKERLSYLAFQGKKFSELTQDEKDDLLRLMAIKMGFITE